FPTSVAVLLHPSCPQARKSKAFDRALPGEEFIDRQRVASARILEAEQTATDRDDHLGLAADDPAFRIRGRQIRKSERAAIRSDYIADARTALLFSHFSHAPPSLPHRVRAYVLAF